MSFPLKPRNQRRLIDFQMGKEVGDGSLSQVFVATERSSGKTFAIKMFNRNFLRSNRKDADVSMEEHCLRRLNHPSIVKLISLFGDEASTYMVLEWCPGGELWDLVKEVGCSDRVGSHYLGQVVEAMSYLRDASMVHRDIKAENVLIGPSGNVKLVDFGSAKDFANPHIKGAGTKSFNKVLEDNVGTPNFMAPEVVKNKFSDHRSDTWSFGCMVYQVLAGLPPFGTNLLHVYNRSLKANLPLAPGMSEAGGDLIKRTVVLNPNARLGGTDIRELRNHAFFKGLPADGTRMEGMHRRSAPVPSLEELCLRALGRRWELLGSRIAECASLAEEGRLREETRAVFERFRRRARREATKQERKERRDGSEGGEPPTSDSEAEWAETAGVKEGA
mmetsp:Transcript_19619/g.49736  ORF Transcript_19619/g.49736 Transcript_19619/m.49736 type:complete len:389 (-) Transcript_19619:12-1178(-)|eukprot:CAMPEP_0183395384 /NCGR_PEP_ID=MMETSP0370-20130417/9276_1 /TAXON_ID=268820 /ORGANISM="Peridinium aciculiferum, Strain PAER-2" /LENGTH=388 /DNA_ID=CAMNT_0025575981 /DNA_START=140 /DNA_END=1306 /DNA_ORIENTATION=+